VCECGKKVATKVAKKLVAREEKKAKKKKKWSGTSILCYLYRQLRDFSHRMSAAGFGGCNWSGIALANQTLSTCQRGKRTLEWAGCRFAALLITPLNPFNAITGLFFLFPPSGVQCGQLCVMNRTLGLPPVGNRPSAIDSR